VGVVPPFTDTESQLPPSCVEACALSGTTVLPVAAQIDPLTPSNGPVPEMLEGSTTSAGICPDHMLSATGIWIGGAAFDVSVTTPV